MSKNSKKKGKRHWITSLFLGRGELPSVAVVYAYPSFVFCWPMIVLGYLFWLTQGISPETEAWIYITVLCLVTLTIGVDLGRNTSVFCLLLIAFLWISIYWLRDTKDVIIFSNIASWIVALDPSVSKSFMFAVSIILSIGYVIMFFMSMLNDRWRITSNEIEKRSLFHRDDSLGRGAKRVLAKYPDLLELLLCGAGTLEIYSATGRSLLASIDNVPFLFCRMRKISKILERMVIADVATLDAEETDEEEGDEGEGIDS